LLQSQQVLKDDNQPGRSKLDVCGSFESCLLSVHMVFVLEKRTAVRSSRRKQM
jgi:hypothetical protein